LQERELNRVGGNEIVKFDIRLIVATHKDLASEVQNGNFREDLYYRIMGLTINLPPLRERGSDILLLAKYFIKAYCKDNKLNLIKLNNEAQNK
jgi:transcriptional regulator with GAF, ATPase, and Fis domain